MKNFNQKLEDIETNIINERTNKKLTTDRAEKREIEANKQIVDKWNLSTINNEQFNSTLNKTLATFKKINPTNNNYFFVYGDDLSAKEKLKNVVSFYLNEEWVSLGLVLSGVSTYITVYDNLKESKLYKIEEIEEAKELFLNRILEIFKNQNQKEIMTRKQVKQKLEEINKLPKEEKKFVKSLFLYKYLVKVAS